MPPALGRRWGTGGGNYPKAMSHAAPEPPRCESGMRTVEQLVSDAHELRLTAVSSLANQANRHDPGLGSVTPS